MKKLIIVPLIFIFCTSMNAQSLNETIDYINGILKTSYFTVYLRNQEMETQYFYSISVDRNGLLTCLQYEKNTKTKEIKEDRIFFKVYLKSIHNGKRNNYKNEDSRLSYFVNTLECNGPESCFIGFENNRPDIYFMIKSETDRDKLDTAFKYLIEIAKNNKEFREKDPFSN